jgi:hypothetical protein
MHATLKQISAAVLCLAIGAFLAPIIFQIIFRPAPADVISTVNFISKGALPIWVIGSCLYAKSIGYSFLWGLLSFTVIGFVALMFFPDRTLPKAEQDAAANP